LKGLEEVLNYTFNNKGVLLEVLTHDNSIRIMNYQRLEVIRDAVLGKLSKFFVVMN
jgi:dsRNA-specific ribonuclease